MMHLREVSLLEVAENCKEDFAYYNMMGYKDYCCVFIYNNEVEVNKGLNKFSSLLKVNDHLTSIDYRRRYVTTPTNNSIIILKDGSRANDKNPSLDTCGVEATHVIYQNMASIHHLNFLYMLSRLRSKCILPAKMYF